MELSVDAQIEALLFDRAAPFNIKKLAAALGVGEDEIENGLKILADKLTGRGICLVRKDDEVALGTAPAAAPLVAKLLKEELSAELSRASLETLTIILYRAPVARAEIDYIRGVNSSFTLRHLQIRGLVEKIVNPADGRSFLYRPTFDLLGHLGLKNISELPDHGVISDQFKKHAVREQTMEE